MKLKFYSDFFFGLINNFIFKLLFKSIILIIFLYYIYFNINFEEVYKKINFSKFNFFFFILIYIFYLLGLILVIFRWKYLLNLPNKKTTKSKIKVNQITHAILYSNLVADIGFIFAFVVKTIIGIQNTIKLNQILSTIVVEKFLSSLSLMLLFILSSSFILIFNNEISINSFYSLYFICIFFLIITFIILGVINYKNEFLANLFSKFFLLKYFISYLKTYHLVKPMVFSILIQLLRILSLSVIPIFLGIEIQYINYFFYLPIIMFVASITFTFNKWGFREAIFIYFYSWVGIDSESILIISITFGIFSIISSVTHLIFYETWYRLFYKNIKNNLDS